ncbi:hypothetical protein OC842_003165 [Tilletia horrida]|uniref:Nucleoporin n=1 Tax=Tilletia horrida TaxID=155126 RepID=A0AAN6GBZ8_9BASI|nr:hypothetical protein OC842_003165 [Tilletia horrida]
MAGAVFQLGRFEALLRLIRAGIHKPERVARSNEWYVAVTRLKADLANLAGVSGPTETERKEIESGRITLGDSTLDLKPDFVKSALQVSKELNVSERYAAFLLQEASLQEARWGRTPVEVGCLLFHLEQQNALSCLQELLEGLLLLQSSNDLLAAEAFKKLEGIVLDILAESASQGTPFAKRLLHRIDTERDIISGIDSAMRSGNICFPEGFYLERVDWMQQSRKAAGTVLYLLAYLKLLPGDGLLEVLRWLQKVPVGGQDPLAVYMLTAALASLDTISETDTMVENSNQIGLADLFADKNFVTTAHSEITAKTWEHADVKHVVLLAWAQVLMLALPRSTALKAELGSQHSDPTILAQTAITGGDSVDALGAFAFLQTSVLSFRQKVLDVLDGEYETVPDAEPFVGGGRGGATGAAGTMFDNLDAALGDGVGQDFQLEVLERVKSLCNATVEQFLPLLRKLQRAEEDAAFSTTRIAQRPGSEPVDRRHDIQAMFDVIATVCRNRPDSGLQFCLSHEGRNTRFLNWALDVRDFGHEQGLFNMLVSISAGPESAWMIHSNVLGAAGPAADGRLSSWPRLFDWVQHYIDTFAAQTSISRPPAHLLPDNEASLLKSFLSLLRNIVHYSDAALAAIYESQEFQALPRLFLLAQQRIPLQLRAALFDALAAFARPNHACADAVTSDLWTLLNSSYTVPAVGARVQVAGQYSLAEDLAAVEASEHIYPATTSFIRLLTALIQPFTSASNARGVKAVTRPLSISESLAKRAEVTRSQNLTPYIDFVVSKVFLRHSDRDFRLHTERWRLIATCLQFIHECLRTYSLDGLFVENEAGVEGAQNPQVLRELVAHPGLDILKRFFQDNRLGKEILSILNPSPTAGFEAVDQHRAQTIFFAHSVRAAMRILVQVLRLQPAFLELLLPSVARAGALAPDAASKVGTVTSYTSFDLQLQRNHESVVQIALFILCEQQDIATLSTKLLGLIADTDFFTSVDQVHLAATRRSANRLVGLLEVSEEAERVRAGAVRQLLRDPATAEPETDALYDDEPLTAPSPEGSVSPTDRTKLAILNLIQGQIDSTRPFPHLGHLLLGFDCHASTASDAFIPTASQGDAEYGVLHAVVDMMIAASTSEDATPLSTSVAERSLAIITKLCRDAVTGEATLRFLRKQGNFFVKMLRSNLLPIEQNERNDTGVVVWSNGRRIVTSETAVLLSLKIQAHLLNGFALEVHSLLANDTHHLAADLVQALFVKSAGESTTSTAGKTSLIALLEGLDFEWHDDRRVDPQDIPLLEDYADMFTVDARYSSTLNSLLLIQQDLQKKGRFYDAKVRPQFEREAASLLAAAAGHEAQLDIAATKHICMIAWRTCLSVVLASANSILRPDISGLVSFDILTAVLARLNSQGGTVDDSQVHELMAGATVDLLSVVRPHCEDTASTLATTGSLGGIATEQLISAFRDILAAITRPSTTVTGRANLYSAAVSFLHLLKTVALAGVDGDFDQDENAKKQDQDSVGDLSTAVATLIPPSSTVATNLRYILSKDAESLVPVVAKDALDSDDAWKTVALTFLAQICGAELSAGARHSPVLDILGRQGYLSNFVHNLRHRDGQLQDAVALKPVSMAPLFVHQALFALFARLAQLRDGLVRLVDVRVLDAVSSLDVLDVRPSGDDMMDAGDDFLPQSSERYHDIVLPVLQLCTVLASRAGRSNSASHQLTDGTGQVTTVHKSIYALLDAHQDTFTNALRAVTRESVSLAQIQLATLLVRLLTSVLPVTGRDVHSKAYLPYHAAINTLLSVYLCEGSWRGKIVPINSDEAQESQTPVPSTNKYTKFDASVDLVVGRLNAALLAYGAAATSDDTNRISPMFSSSLTRPDANNGLPFMPRATAASLARSTNARVSNMATLGTLIRSLEEHATTLEDCRWEVEKIQALMESSQSWVVETCAEILGISLADARAKNAAALRAWALKHLREHQKFVRALILLKLDAVEILLILLLRHFAFYLDFLPDTRRADKSIASAASTGLDRLSIRTEGAAAVNEAIERLSLLTVSTSILPGGDSRHALIQMAARRLQAITVDRGEGA